MAVRLLLSEVYPALYEYGKQLAMGDDHARHPSQLESLAIQKLEELDGELLHCLLCHAAEYQAKQGCVDGYRSVMNNRRRMST
jgi:hypothetical protein